MTHNLTEDDLERRTDSLLQDLEAAKDPVAYRQRYHKPASSKKDATTQTKRSSRTTVSSGRVAHPSSRMLWNGSSLFITVLAILLGTLMGSLLSLLVA